MFVVIYVQLLRIDLKRQGLYQERLLQIILMPFQKTSTLFIDWHPMAQCTWLDMNSRQHKRFTPTSTLHTHNTHFDTLLTLCVNFDCLKIEFSSSEYITEHTIFVILSTVSIPK